MHASTLTSMADGIADELNLPYRLVRIRKRDDVNGNWASMQIHVEGGTEYGSISSRRIELIEDMGWEFICFKTTEDECYALFEGGPFDD